LEAAYEKASGQAVWIVKLASLTALIVGSAATGIVSLTWRPLWRLVPLLGRVVFPDLNGRWHGELFSTWSSPDTQVTPSPIKTTIWIRQGLFNTSVRLQTDESESFSTRAFLEPARDSACFRIWYTYDNEPAARYRHFSAPHEGVSFLQFDAGQPTQLTGRYYTSRKTTGDITLTRVNSDPSS
jgi:hypothetical protein